MNTREEIISLLSKSKKPLRAKEIAFTLKKTNPNIRKILSNLHKEGKITREGYGKYKSSVNESVNESVNVKKSVNVSVNVEGPEAKKLINREINKYRRTYFQKLKANNPEAYEKIRSARYKYYKKWRAENPNYNKDWLRAYHKKHPEKFRGYTRRYWLKKALSQAGS